MDPQTNQSHKHARKPSARCIDRGTSASGARLQHSPTTPTAAHHKLSSAKSSLLEAAESAVVSSSPPLSSLNSSFSSAPAVSGKLIAAKPAMPAMAAMEPPHATCEKASLIRNCAKKAPDLDTRFKMPCASARTDVGKSSGVCTQVAHDAAIMAARPTQAATVSTRMSRVRNPSTRALAAPVKYMMPWVLVRPLLSMRQMAMPTLTVSISADRLMSAKLNFSSQDASCNSLEAASVTFVLKAVLLSDSGASVVDSSKMRGNKSTSPK
mmetsp:Transcript_51031/g.143435  ORF Transcript_51031/g.143435 Transcript_51031/m.143435 type:complete len:267 (-) Transcript_51031:877-1677(-)